MLKNWIFFLLALGAVTVTPAACAAERTVTGTANYRERIALPPTARFEAVILDVARADAPAVVLARTTINNPGQPPIRFAATYDDAKLDPRARHVVRATVTVDGTLWFTTDTSTPVVTGGDARVDLLLRRVGASETRGKAAPALDGAGLLGGAFRYFADAATFTLCRSGEELPVAMEGAYRDLEEAYAAKRTAPAAPLYVMIEGAIEPRAGMEGPPRPTIVVRRFLAAWPGEKCERNRSNAALANTYWRIAVLKGETLAAVEGHPEANLILRTDPERQASATAGCNRMVGTYETREGGGLTFGRFASTRMACPPPLDARERALADVLAATREYAIEGPAL
ncbi:MAG: YbaY family lipoprotein [Methylocystis sp.]